MPKMRSKGYRDPVHDLISWRDDPETGALMTGLIDTAAVQRLRGIRQLGLASLVYHGAEHSRFSHSIGVAWVAWRMVQRFDDLSMEERRRVTAAALLHDIGHAPFSHVLERVFGFHHETWSARMVRDPNSEVHRVLSNEGPDFAESVAARLTGEDGHWSHAVVSSQLDADRCDYLLRDAMMTGIQVGRFDMERILWMLGHDERGLWVDERAWEAVEGYLMARYHMYRLVYFHRTTRAAESMLLRTFGRAKRLHAAGTPDIVPPGTPWGALFNPASDDPTTAMRIQDWMALRDTQLWALLQGWSTHSDTLLASLADGLLHRRLFKTVYQLRERGPAAAQRARERAERVRAELSDDERDLFSVDEAQDTPYRPYGVGRPSSASIRLRTVEGKLERIEDRSAVVAALAEATTHLHRWYAHPRILPKLQRLLREFEDVPDGD